MTPLTPMTSLRIHHELLRLTRGVGGLRLAIADGVDRLEALGGVKTLGFPCVDAYSRERLGRSGRWLGDARTLGRRLSGLPMLREAYLSGRLSSSKVELLARHLVRVDRVDEDERDEAAAIEMARALTVRELRARLGEAEGGGVDNSDERGRGRVQLTRHVDRIDAVAFEGAIRLMGALGESTRGAAIEGLLAEGLTTLMNRAELAPDLVNAIAGPWPPEACTTPEAESSPSPDTDIGPVSEPSPEGDPEMGLEPPYIDASFDTVDLLDLELRALAAELARRDLSLGQLALEFELRPQHRGLPFAHGHRTVDGYYREVLRVAPSSMAARIALAKRAARLPRRHRLRERDAARPGRHEPKRGGVARAGRYLDNQAIPRTRRRGRAARESQRARARSARAAKPRAARGVPGARADRPDHGPVGRRRRLAHGLLHRLPHRLPLAGRRRRALEPLVFM